MKIKHLFETVRFPDETDYYLFMQEWGDPIMDSLHNAEEPLEFPMHYFLDAVEDLKKIDPACLFRGIQVPSNFLETLRPGQTHLGVHWANHEEATYDFARMGGMSVYDDRFPGTKAVPSTIGLILVAGTTWDHIDMYATMACRFISQMESEVRLNSNAQVTLFDVRAYPGNSWPLPSVFTPEMGGVDRV